MSPNTQALFHKVMTKGIIRAVLDCSALCRMGTEKSSWTFHRILHFHTVFLKWMFCHLYFKSKEEIVALVVWLTEVWIYIFVWIRWLPLLPWLLNLLYQYLNFSCLTWIRILNVDAKFLEENYLACKFVSWHRI